MKAILRISVVALVLSLATVAVLKKTRFGQPFLPVYGVVPEFTLTERSGQPFKTDDLKGKVSLINFFFTACEGPCPLMSSKIFQLQKEYEGSPLVQFVSITVDPDNDSLAVLNDYANKHHALKNWSFLRGPLKDIADLSLEGFKLSSQGLPAIHTIQFVLIDSKNQIRGYYDSNDPDRLLKLRADIQELVQEI